MSFRFKPFSRSHAPFAGFTLLELLIVIAILAILASVTFVVLNPLEQLKKARDSRRLADLRSLNSALGIYESQATNPQLGTSTFVYLSLADTNPACSSWSLPPAPPGYSYSCVPASTLRKTNSSGWVPVNLQSLSIGSPLAVLPIDPINNSQYYYTYVPGGSFMLTGLMEAQGGTALNSAITDGGRMPGVYETGSNLSLGPFTRDKGLVGYWPLDEASGTIAYDYSGQGNNGTKTGGQWLTGASCVKGGCFETTINAVTENINPGDPVSRMLDFSNTDDFSYIVWGKASSQEDVGQWNPFFKSGWTSGTGYRMVSSGGFAQCQYSDGDGSGLESASQAFNLLDNNWHMFTCVMDRKSGALSIFIDGVYKAADTSLTEGSAKNSSTALTFGESSGTYEANAAVDDVRIYNRALSFDEIRAIYDATR